ncbi:MULTISPECIES: PIN domain-containing protein [unclassified Frankia]|uniref:PIN domain-containing protein n=1 Tax=unclassified Frankia TaxID=2632575 RepID=UPI00202474AB
MSEQKSLVLDANILIRAALGKRVRDLVITCAGKVAFFAPDVAYLDARRYLTGILSKRGLDPQAALAVLDGLEPIVLGIDADTYGLARDAALARIVDRDADDWPVLATALVLDCPIWTEDQDFFGTGVPTWTTDRVGLFFDSHG